MVIAHVVSGLMYGGGQKVALDIVTELRARKGGLQPSLILMGDRLAPPFQAFAGQWTQLRGYDGHYNRPSTLIRSALGLRKILSDEAVDVVHSHGWDADVVSGLARQGVTPYHVVHQHILADWTLSKRFVHRARRAVTRAALNRRGTRWVAVSGGVKASLEPLKWLNPANVQVVWNGVDLERFRPASDRLANPRPIIGVAARLAPMKGLEYLIQAVAELGRRGVACELDIAGDGPAKSDLISLARSGGITNRVRFQGHRADMPAFYHSIDVLALPSVALEGLPLTILEAMAVALPVVSTQLSGIPEVVVNGVTGTLVEPANATALVDGLLPLLNSPDLRRQFGAAARQRAEVSFSVHRMVDELTALYSGLCADTRRPRRRVRVRRDARTPA